MSIRTGVEVKLMKKYVEKVCPINCAGFRKKWSNFARQLMHKTAQNTPLYPWVQLEPQFKPGFDRFRVAGGANFPPSPSTF